MLLGLWHKFAICFVLFFYCSSLHQEEIVSFNLALAALQLFELTTSAPKPKYEYLRISASDSSEILLFSYFEMLY